MNRLAYRIGIVFIAAGLLVLGIARLRSDSERASAEPDYGHVPEFSLIDSGGRTVTRQDFSGKVWIANFIFTSCAGTCPMMASQIRTLQDDLPADVRFVSFTVDPARDTPTVLADYAKRLGADSERWLFVTGDRQSLYDLSIKGFKLGVDDKVGTEAEPITHSSRFVLIDRNGRIRGYYGATDEDTLKRVAADVKGLL